MQTNTGPDDNGGVKQDRLGSLIGAFADGPADGSIGFKQDFVGYVEQKHCATPGPAGSAASRCSDS